MGGGYLEGTIVDTGGFDAIKDILARWVTVEATGGRVFQRNQLNKYIY